MINKSRFICFLKRIDGEPDARAFIEQHRKDHWNANHNCTAFVTADGLISRSSDDGEPSGTAGAPMLEMLNGHHMTDTLAIVTRYFGGVKLGAGGLVRAYGRAVSSALDTATVHEIRYWSQLHVTVNHDLAGSLEGRLRSHDDIDLQDVTYSNVVTFHLAAADEKTARELINSYTAGAATVVDGDEVRIEIPSRD
ncbi:YigZ family protein [Haloglycomyces albus]|uniref:YigZ family protein n=1 Tax=Haloglycomyces albus TaxID=526067 RepID=UPI001FDEF9A9